MRTPARTLSIPAALGAAAALLLCFGAASGRAEDAGELDPLFHSFLGLGRGRIGVQVQPLSPELRKHFGAPADRGLLVARVEPDGPGERAGLRVGDVALEAGGEALAQPMDLLRRVARVPAAGSLELAVLRDGERHTVRVEPDGEPAVWADPEHWRQRLERGVRRGGRELRERLEELERRLEELERRWDESAEDGARET